jgi:uncharacterized protein (TIGR03790 family)
MSFGVALTLCPPAFAGGSGLNVVVVVNQNSTNSVQLGNYYCEKRGVPPQNLLRINWTGNNIDWTRANFDSLLRDPLTAMLASRQLTSQVEYVVLSMDIPYRVNETTGLPASSGYNGTTAVLFYGFKTDGCSNNCPANIPSCNLPGSSANAYAGSEGVFRQTPPVSALSNSWLTIMLTATNLEQAKLLVDRGVNSDASFPTQTVFLAKSVDLVRSLRYRAFDNVIFDTRLRGNYTVQATNTSSPFQLGAMLGFQNGMQQFSISDPPSVPGAMADNLTSFSGFLFENAGHTTALDFINNHATASYGTVIEPCAYAEKFASPQNYFYQARGFSIAECYYQSLTNPYQGILVGEPLAAPFALPAAGAWTDLPAVASLAGITNLSAQFTAADEPHPVQQVDLFIDGLYSQTLTNIPPYPDNILSITLNGFSTNFTVPANASLKAIASNLTLRLNTTTYSNATKVVAAAHGDRIELRSMNLNVAGSNVTLVVGNNIGAAPVLTTRLFASRPNFLDTTASGRRQFTFAGELVLGDYLQCTITRTNGQVTTVSVTNESPTAAFTDFAQALLAAINAAPTLQGADGLVAEDLLIGAAGPDPAAQFNLRARAPGFKEAQLQAGLSGTFSILPTSVVRLNENLTDLQPRNHLYLTAGLTNLSLTFPFNTTTNADGDHELTAVAYEGTHVRTQKRVSQNIRIQNNGWAATLASLVGDTNAAREASLQFAVVANTNGITKIELFSTGGSLGASNNVASATFAIPAASLDIGRHPFYAVVTRNDGTQYRTEPKWICIVGADAPFTVAVVDPTPTLAWPATPGRDYKILSATNVTAGFTLRDGVTPTNSTGFWSETNNSAPQRFYRVKTP